MAELAAIRRDKFWVSRSEIFDGAVGIAAACFDNANRIIQVWGGVSTIMKDNVFYSKR